MKTDKEVCFIDDLTRIKFLMATPFQTNDEFLVKYQINHVHSSLGLSDRFIESSMHITTVTNIVFIIHKNCTRVYTLVSKLHHFPGTFRSNLGQT